MLLPLQPLGVFIGGRYAPNNGFATSWQANDGVVPTYSMDKDSTGSLVVFNGNSQKGKWNQMPQLDHLDHLAVVGITLHTQVKDLYVSHAQLLASLPASTSTASSSSVSIDSVTTTTEAAAPSATTISVALAVAQLKAAAASVQTKADLEKLCATPLNAYAKSYCTNMLNNANNATATTRRLRG
ncbi:hypothetical protein Gpo141_00008789 [Globisporangium polare]